jgi:hypothetical protein
MASDDHAPVLDLPDDWTADGLRSRQASNFRRGSGVR